MFNDYIRRELNYKVDMPYYTSARDLGPGAFTWNWARPNPNSPAAEVLRWDTLTWPRRFAPP